MVTGLEWKGAEVWVRDGFPTAGKDDEEIPRKGVGRFQHRGREKGS